MAAANGKASTPSLSSLQSALRKAPVAKSAAPKPAQPATAAQGTKRPLPAEQAQSGAPPLKKVIVVAKTPAPAGKAPISKAPVGTLAKSAGAAVISRAPAGNPAPQSKSGIPVAKTFTDASMLKVKAGGLAAAPAGAGADVGLSVGAVNELVGTIEAAPVPAKIRSMVRLADVLGERLEIEHINHFLRALKKKVVERAQKDGVRVPAPAAKPPVGGQPALAAKSTPERAPAASQPVMGSAAKSAAPGALSAKSAGATPVVKAAVSKAPVAKTAAPAKPKPAQAPPRPAAPAAPASPPAEEGGSDDLMFDLLGEIQSNPVCADGEFNEARLGEVLKKLWDGAARRTKDWIAGWQAMAIPQDKQTQALSKFLNMTFMESDAERAPTIVADLVKAHKVKLRAIEEVLVAFGQNLDGILALNEQAWHVYAQFLVNVFPRPANHGWGWSRIGWSWQSWWKFLEQCTQSLEETRSSDVLCLILRLIQEREGVPLMEIPIWTEGDKLQKVLTRLSTLGGCEADAAIQKLSESGVTVSM